MEVHVKARSMVRCNYFGCRSAVFSLAQCNQDDPANEITAKPVIYLYPEKPTAVNVALDVDGTLLSTWLVYRNGWTVTAQPDSLLRVFMAWKGVDEPVEIVGQIPEPFVRDGFTVVEWGGCQVES